MESMAKGNRERLWIKNVSEGSVSIGDLPHTPTFLPGDVKDVYQYHTLFEVNQSLDLHRLVVGDVFVTGEMNQGSFVAQTKQDALKRIQTVDAFEANKLATSVAHNKDIVNLGNVTTPTISPSVESHVRTISVHSNGNLRIEDINSTIDCHEILIKVHQSGNETNGVAGKISFGPKFKINNELFTTSSFDTKKDRVYYFKSIYSADRNEWHIIYIGTYY